MPPKTRVSRIKKTATAVETLVAPAPVVHELTNMTVEEVSLVDRPANERKFLLRKKAEEAAKKAAEEVAMAAQRLRSCDVDPVADLAALVSATKADITVSTPSGDVTLTVEDAPVQIPPAPTELIDKVKAATLAGIDAISARVAKFRADVESGSVSSYSSTGVGDALWGHIYYIKGMLEALYDIGGPSWEIEAAGDSVTKSHKAITASRVQKFAAVHKCMTYAMKDFAGVMKELTQDQESSDDLEVDSSAPATAAVGKSAPVPAPVVAPVVPAVVVPVVPPEVLAQMSELAKSVGDLNAIVAKQAADIAKARNAVGGSNVQVVEERVATTMPDDVMLVWPADMNELAKPKRPSRF